MNNVGEKFLPLGTVVMLKGASKRLMITGFCTMDATNENSVMYDYSGCMYPEGVISSDQTALFNHDQIEKIYHMGLVDQEETDFKSKLKQLLYANNVVAESTPQVIRQQEGVVPVVASEAAPVQQQEIAVPPVGPGLPGYVAPQQPIQQPSPVTNGIQFDAQGNVVAAPVQTPFQQTEQVSTQLTNIQFDENGTVVSA